MKKEYIKPEMMVEEILLEGMLASSLEVIEGEVTPFANGRREGRGTWGNLWAEE